MTLFALSQLRLANLISGAVLCSLILVGAGCRTAYDPALGKPPEHASRVQVAILSSEPRSVTTAIEVLDAPPSRPHRQLALITCDGESNEEGVMTQAIIFHARRIGANALIKMPSETRRGGFGIPNGLIFRYTAIVYSAQ